jgi:hypothetical protein
VISTSFSAGINLGDLLADVDVDVLGVVDAVDLAPAEQQPPVPRLAEVAHDEAGVVDRLAAGDRTFESAPSGTVAPMNEPIGMI